MHTLMWADAKHSTCTVMPAHRITTCVLVLLASTRPSCLVSNSRPDNTNGSNVEHYGVLFHADTHTQSSPSTVQGTRHLQQQHHNPITAPCRGPWGPRARAQRHLVHHHHHHTTTAWFTSHGRTAGPHRPSLVAAHALQHCTQPDQDHCAQALSPTTVPAIQNPGAACARP